MSEIYNIRVKNGQSLADIAIAEYGTVEGISLLIEDNPDELSSFTDEPDPGTILNIRLEPELEKAKFEYVRKERKLSVIQVIQEISGTCPSMADLMNTSTGTQIKVALDGVSKSTATFAAYTTAEKLTHLTDGDEQELVELMDSDNAIAGIQARPASEELDIFFGLAGDNTPRAKVTAVGTVADGFQVRVSSYAQRYSAQYERIDTDPAKSFNYASPIYTVINPATLGETIYNDTYPVVVPVGHKLDVKFNKPTGASPGQIYLRGKLIESELELAAGDYTAEYLALKAACPDPFSPDYEFQINELLKAWIDNSSGTSIKQYVDFAYLLANETQGNSLKNIIAPGTFAAAPINAPTFHTGKGWQGGSGKYLDTLFNPTAQAATCKYKQDDACYFAWIVDNELGNAVENSASPFGAGPNASLLPRYTSTTGTFTANTPYAFQTANNSSAEGFYFIVRSSSGQYRVYKDNVLINTLVYASSSVPNLTFKILTANGTSFSQFRVAACGVGGAGLEAHRANLRNSLLAFLTFTEAV